MLCLTRRKKKNSKALKFLLDDLYLLKTFFIGPLSFFPMILSYLGVRAVHDEDEEYTPVSKDDARPHCGARTDGGRDRRRDAHWRRELSD